jgi:adenine-specific DNA-methyltransferase
MAGTKKQTKKHVSGAQGGLGNVTDYRHDEATRKNNPPAKIAAEGTVPLMPKIRYEYSPRLAPALRFDSAGAADQLPELLQKAQRQPLTAAEAEQLGAALRNQEPWLEWANKREKRWFDVDPVALHIHERVSPQAILRVAARQDIEPSLFGDPQQSYQEAVQFYRHEIPWTNRLILGDSLQVMTSLSRREDLAAKVQMIYMDPPYGIRFGSNFQVSIDNRDMTDRESDLTREPEMIKAFRDTWSLGLHSYLSYLRDRLLVAKELLCDSGSIFLQIGDENLPAVSLVMDEVFGGSNRVQVITVKKKSSTQKGQSVVDYLLWYARDKSKVKMPNLYTDPGLPEDAEKYRRVELPSGERRSGSLLSAKELEQFAPFFVRDDYPVVSQHFSPTRTKKINVEGKTVFCGSDKQWRYDIETGMRRLELAGRLRAGDKSAFGVVFWGDSRLAAIHNVWTDMHGESDPVYVVQTNRKIVERCILMSTEPGDLVLDPTCGSGTTAFVAEEWARRWITTDTSRVAIAIARQRLMTAKYSFFRFKNPSLGPKGGFICKSVGHITLKSIAHNENLDPIFARHQPVLDETLQLCNQALKKVPRLTAGKLYSKYIIKQKTEGRSAMTEGDRRRWLLPEAGEPWEHWQVPFDTDSDWPPELADTVKRYRAVWRSKMDEVNACIAANAEQEELIDQPKIENGVVRVSGPFTVEAVQPPEMSLGDVEVLAVGEFAGAPNDLETFAIRMVESRVDQEAQNLDAYLDQMIRYLKLDGVMFPNNRTMKFHRLEQVMDGTVIHAEGRWQNGGPDADSEGKSNIGVVFGPQYGPITAMQVEEAIRQASRRGYDHLVLAGFSFDGTAQAVIAEGSHPRLKVHSAHIRPDVNPAMAGLLKEQPGSQLFSVFGQPRTRLDGPDAQGEYTVTMEGVDIYNPVNNTVTPTKSDKVAAWFVDGDYDGRTFCITQAFFPDKSAWEKLSKALNGVVDAERFDALSGTKSLPFPAGKHSCVGIKVIDPRGNEVMRIHKLEGGRDR